MRSVSQIAVAHIRAHHGLTTEWLRVQSRTTENVLVGLAVGRLRSAYTLTMRSKNRAAAPASIIS